MKKVFKIILIIVVVYLLIGVVKATQWSMNYDPKINSFPNDAAAFILNTVFWLHW